MASFISGKSYESDPQARTASDNRVVICPTASPKGGARVALNDKTEWEKLKKDVDALYAPVAPTPTPPTPTPPVPPVLVGPAKPTLTTPITVTVTQANKTNVQLDPTKDYILVQSGPLTGSVRVYGGRNIIWEGMRVTIPFVKNSADMSFVYARRSPQFDNFTGHLYVADFRINGDVSEGIVANCKGTNAKVTIFNGRAEILTRAYTRVSNGGLGPDLSAAPTWGTKFSVGQPTYDGMVARATGAWWDEHNDFFQSWAMPNTIHIEHVTVITPCQFNYVEPASGKKLILKDINVHPYEAPWDHSRIAAQLFWHDGWDVSVDNVWADWGSTGLTGVKPGIPPAGDFVPAA